MNDTPLEDEVRDALHRTADPLARTPLDLAAVHGRARRIQRRRAATAAAAVAAVVAVAVPIGISATGGLPDRTVPPATQPPSPTPTSLGTVRLDPRSAEVVDSTTIPYLDVAAPSLTTDGEVLPLPRVYDQMTPYLDGWAAVTNDEGALSLVLLDGDLQPTSDPVPTGGLAVSPDHQRVTWSEHDGSAWQVVAAAVDGSAAETRTEVAGSADAVVTPVGFVSATGVAVTRNDGTGRESALVVDDGTTTRIPGLQKATGAAQATGLVAGVTSSDVDGACSAVVDVATLRRLWETCEHTVSAFSPDGTRIAGLVASPEASPDLAVLDAATGEQVVDFAATGGRRQVVGLDTQLQWEDAGTVVGTMVSGAEQYVVRLGLDGSVQRVGGSVEAEPGVPVVRLAEVR